MYCILNNSLCIHFYLKIDILQADFFLAFLLKLTLCLLRLGYIYPKLRKPIDPPPLLSDKGIGRLVYVITF